MSINELEISYKPVQHSSKTHGIQDTCQVISLIETFQNQASVQVARGARFPTPSRGSMQFPGRDLDKVHCFKELTREGGERSLHCSDQGQPIWLISAESNKAEFFM